VDASQALAYERRSEIITIRGRRFRISEPRPRLASLLLTHVGKMIRPWVTRLLGGQVVRRKPAQCPQCGAEGKAEPVNGERWLCQEPVVEADRSRPCGALWPREVEVGPDGKPDVMTLGRALADPGWRAVFAVQIGHTIDELDPEDAHALAIRMILAGTEFEPIPGHWTAITSDDVLDTALASARIGGMGVIRLAKEHLRVWALPSLVDDWSDTSPVSSTSATPGGSEIQEHAPQASAPGGRVPPRTRKHRA
jgi:hypothetical protein